MDRLQEMKERGTNSNGEPHAFGSASHVRERLPRPSTAHLPHESARSRAGSQLPIPLRSFDSHSATTAATAVRNIKCEVLANWLHAKCEEKLWSTGLDGEAVFVKKAKGSYARCPTETVHKDSGLYRAVVALNAQVWWLKTSLIITILTMNSAR